MVRVFIADGVCQGLHWKLCSHMFMLFINYMEMVRADVEKLINDNVIRGIKNKTVRICNCTSPLHSCDTKLYCVTGQQNGKKNSVFINAQ